MPHEKLTSYQKPSLFGKIGGYLSDTYASGKVYEALDLSGFDKSSLQKYTSQFGSSLGKELLGRRVGGALDLLKKVVPAETWARLSDDIYQKLAQGAYRLARFKLQKDARFAKLSTLTDDQKEAFAQDLINQNRTWLSAGGAFGVLGVKGVALDTAWVLLVSLCTVYELAIIYGADIEGDDGVRTVYGILVATDETLIHQKQVLLTALTLGQMVLKNAQNTGLADELLALSTSPLAGQYTKHLEEFLGIFNLDKADLDKFNTAWLRHLCTLGFVGVAVHYNNQLFEEVVGTARATFGQKVAVPLLGACNTF